MVDQNLDGGAGEGAEDLELEPNPNEDEGKGSDPDPLDDIQDPVARAEAKKHRAIGRRVKDKEETPADPAPKVEASKEFLTKADFYKSNERKAIREITADAEIKAVWNEIIPFYTARRGKETAEDIKEDLQDAITIYRARNPVIVADDSAAGLIVTPAIKPGGGGQGKVPLKTEAPPNFKLPTQPKDWYAKPKS